MFRKVHELVYRGCYERHKNCVLCVCVCVCECSFFYVNRRGPIILLVQETADPISVIGVRYGHGTQMRLPFIV